jgi:hypothetical protein
MVYITISKRSLANLRKSKKREAKLAGIFYYLDHDFIKIKYVCYVDNSLLGITELEKKIEKNRNASSLF